MPIEDEGAARAESIHVPAAAHKDAEAKEERERIGTILDSLPSALRIPLIMRDMDELSYDGIAASLGLGLSAVKMRIKRARETFRQRYREVAGMTEAKARPEISGQQGVLAEINATHAILRSEDREISIANGAFFDAVARSQPGLQ